MEGGANGSDKYCCSVSSLQRLLAKNYLQLDLHSPLLLVKSHSYAYHNVKNTQAVRNNNQRSVEIMLSSVLRHA